MNENLKNCPYCGTKPIIEHWFSNGAMYMVKCNNSDCKVPYNGYQAGHDLSKVKEQWNKRAEVNT